MSEFISTTLLYLGSNDSNSYTAISSKLCGTQYDKVFATYSKYLKITFDRWNGASVSYSGFVAGYIMFSKCQLFICSSDFCFTSTVCVLFASFSFTISAVC